MFKKIVEFFTGKKPESKYAHPLDAVTTPNVPQAPYKLEPPADPTPIPYAPAEAVPIPYRYEPPAETSTLLYVPPEPAPAKKPRKAAVKKPAAIAAPAEKKPRAKKTTQ
jgi:hypothetical protein